jgi:hypothetical protein
MILVLAVLASFLVGMIRTGGRVGSLSRARLRSVELIFIAFLMQVPLLRSSPGRVEQLFSLTSMLFLWSYPLLLVFVWRNRHLAGFWLLGLGVTLNLLVLVVNGGFMPVSPDALAKLNPSIPPDQWETGHHRHHSKGIILERADTALWELSDIFVLPPPFPVPTAFSIGDVLIATGAFLFLQRTMSDDRVEQEEDGVDQLGSVA